MHLSAISIGYAIPDGSFDASVHSVFQSALNLRLHESNQLLTLVTADEADLPQGIRLDTANEFSFEKFSAGGQATCRDGLLRLDTLTVTLRGARRWKCDLPALEFDSTDPTVSSAWSFVWDALNQRQIESNADIIAEKLFRPERTLSLSKRQSKDNVTHALRLQVSIRSEQSRPTQPSALRESNVAKRAGKAMRELVEATRRYDMPRAESSVRALIGLGSGLTPSGDDLLIGYMAGLWCAVGSQDERVQFAKNLGDTLIRHSSQTNEISRTYLYHAAQGQVSSLLANLAEAIGRGENPDRLVGTAESAMRVGHTSGMDVVTGLLAGLIAWVNTGAKN